MKLWALCCCCLLVNYVRGLQEKKINVVTTTKSKQEKYNTKCGFLGWKRCTRYRTKYYKEHACVFGYRSTDDVGCPYAICDGEINPTGACNIDYPNSHIIYSNGVTQKSSGGTCNAPEFCKDCNQGFYSSPFRCRMCTAITNCDLETCTSSSDQVCSRCEGVVLQSKGNRAYAISADNKACVKACSWRSDSTRCYPGTCDTEHATSCSCMTGFSGTHCEKINSSPTIMFNSLKLQGSGLNSKEAPVDPNSGSPQDISWTNINDGQSIQYSFNSQFVPGGALPTAHAYIEAYKVGIIGGSVVFKLQRGGSTIKSTTRQCGGASQLNPNTNVFTCQETIPATTVLSSPVQNEDIMKFTFSAVNGGHVKVRNKESNALNTESFSGKASSRTFSLGFDFINPHHCTAGPSPCSDSMLTVPIVSMSSPVPATWRGWKDNIALDYYTLSVYDLIDRDVKNDNSKLEEKSIVFSKDISVPTENGHIDLTSPGAYAAVLSAYDLAGNHKSARRVFIYDATSVVETVANTQLLVTSAAVESAHLWQWTDESVTIDWNLRYTNPLHDRNKWLKGVASVSDVQSSYDDNSFSRGINPISNVQGIVKYLTAYQVDHAGGTTITTTPSDSEFISQNLNQRQIVTPELKDGDTLRFWIRAFDIRDEYLEEETTVNIDTTPPIIQNLWLTRQDRLNVSVHSVEDFSKMTFEYLAYDIHSGLETVSWRLFDNYTGVDIVHGIEHLSAQGESLSLEECQQKYGEYARGSNCYCTPGVGCFHRHYQVTPRVILSDVTHGGVFHDTHKGVHDSDYFLEVTVMNKAKISSTMDFKITIDASPPHPGVVHDGQLGQPEVDFQDSLQIHGHWGGFFDKESGVKFYQYKFAERCLDAVDFGLSMENPDISETYSTHATWEAPTPGKYYLTVVAYNTALEPSSPVCSDGVTVDQTSPVISHIAVDNSRVVPGLVQSGDQVWFIDNQRRRSQIVDPNDSCRSKTTAIEMVKLKIIPLQTFSNGTQVLHSVSFCDDKQQYPSLFINTFYINKQQHLSVNWTGLDTESSIYDYEVGLMSDVSGEAAPDIHPYTSTHHHPHYHNFHPGLTTGQHFYIAVKSINKAGLSTIQIIGPVIVHTQIPGFSGEISVNLNIGFLVARWGAESFTELENNHLKYQLAVGTEDEATSILPFSSLKSGGGCVLSSPPTCAAVPLTDLPWDLHHSHVYHVSIRVTNIVDLSTVALSQPYVHDIRLPSIGVVMDVSPQDELDIFKITKYQDSDHQLSTKSLTARWYGFDDGVLDVTYRLGIGETPGKATIVPFQDVGKNLEHAFENLHLVSSKEYFVTVEAKSLGGITLVSSDGIRIVNTNFEVKDVAILDGLACKNTDKIIWQPDHYKSHQAVKCVDDAVYQKSTSVFTAHWDRPMDLSHQYPDVQWRLEKKLAFSDDIWNTETEFSLIGTSDHLMVTGISLEPGITYRAGVRFCASTVCTRPLHSDGVTILHSPPAGGDMHVSYTEKDAGSEMQVEFARFYDPDILVRRDAYAVMDRYEWCLTDNSHSGRTLTKWVPLEGIQYQGDQGHVDIALTGALNFTKCLRLAVRGYNKLGLFTVVSADIKNCSAYDPQLVKPHEILDAVGSRLSEGVGHPISFDLNDGWIAPDVDYTPYTNILSAVWPTLRHRNYRWAVVSGHQLDPTFHYKRENLMTVSDPCVMPDVIKCGHTENEFVNIAMDAPLQHGYRYYICVHADAMMVKNEKWNQSLEEVNACSDGVTVDLTPPEGGRVFIGGLAGNGYQASKTELEVHWDGFVDIEELGMSPHSSGIAHYEVYIGSIPGGRDIIHSNVGVVNHVTFYHLNLQDGHTVYATAKAVDFVNQSTLVISEGLLIDSTPPSETDKQITVTDRYIISPVFEACWEGVFVDEGSGMKTYQVSVGSRPGYHDILQPTATDETCKVVDVTDNLVDGHVLYVTVKGFNKAGLQTQVTSRPLVVDTSPPSIGHVYDGQQQQLTTDMKDLDFVTNTSYMGAYWEGIFDPHSSISHYLINVGTCQGCTDVVDKHNVGARTAMKFADLAFSPGIKYYVEVTGCNMARLCSVGRSDGVMLDVTPPVAGILQDGTSDNDIQFQASRYFLGCKWRGFYDPESGLDHYEWRVGTTPGGDDILPARNVALEDVAFQVLSQDEELPVGTRMYSTVVAYNKAGMTTEVSSNGFLVDDSAPVVVSAPRHVNDLSTVSTSFSRTTLKIVWEIKDDESYIERQYLSISSHQLGEFNSSLIKVPGLLREYTYTQLNLHDGSLYTVKITACNMAGLCTSAATEEILLDSSPPVTGSLAVETDHSARLSRHQTGWMTWTHTSLSLAWLGFSDLHSGIQHYIVTVGSQEFLSDLNKNGESVEVPYIDSGTDHHDEGSVQTFIIDTGDLSSTDSVFVAIWAVNKVGLKSKPLHHELTLVPGGDLELVRRCQLYNCHGSCVCAVQDGTCSLSDGCSQQDGGVVMVTDVTGLHLSPDDDEDFSCFDTYMAAQWTPSDSVKADVKYYEVSIGDTDLDSPEGVYDAAKERVWFDVGRDTSAVLALPKDKNLSSGHRYSFFVRTWFSDNSYSISKSDGVLLDTTRPQVTQLGGYSVKEHSESVQDRDVDFQKRSDKISISWNNVFLPGLTGLLQYVVYISTTPGGHSIHTSGDLTSTSYTAEGLSLKPNTVYYTSVLAYDKAGLVSWAYSDGVQVDVEPPVSGIVYDGQGAHDVDYQSSSTMISASWHGFSDADSTITKYHWCVGTASDKTNCSVVDWQDVGLHVSASREVPELNPGTKVWSKVYAEDVVGNKSDVMVSNGAVIDTTPPEAQNMIYLDDNLIQNPSFEDKEVVISSPCSSPQPVSWIVDEGSCADVKVDGLIAMDGQSYVVFSGSIKQDFINLEPGQKYMVSFHAGYPKSIANEDKLLEGFITFDDKKYSFQMDPHRCKGVCSLDDNSVILWNPVKYSCVATKTTTQLKIGTVTKDMKMAVDHVTLQRVSYDELESGSLVEDHLEVHSVFHHHWSSLHVVWHFKDEESPITEYKWAVGVTQGGNQIVDYQSVGRESGARATGLRLSHGSLVFITVVATNAAGLTAVSYSRPVVVDMTPPVFGHVNDGLGGDIDFIAPETMSVSWEVTDKESDVDFCDWAVGSASGRDDVKEFERIPKGELSAHVNLTDKVTSPNMKVYSTVRCFNKAGLTSVTSSDGVVLVTGSGESSLSGVELLQGRSLVFRNTGTCHADPNRVRLRWEESGDPSLLSTIVRAEGGEVLYQTSVPTTVQYTYCDLHHLHLSPLTDYNISITPRNFLKQNGDPSSLMFTQHSAKPTINKDVNITIVSTSGGEVTLSWTDVFTSPWSELIYEVDIGSVVGGADIVEKQVTKSTNLDLELSPADRTKHVFVSVTAIDPCGDTQYFSQRLDLKSTK